MNRPLFWDDEVEPLLRSATSEELKKAVTVDFEEHPAPKVQGV